MATGDRRTRGATREVILILRYDVGRRYGPDCNSDRFMRSRLTGHSSAMVVFEPELESWPNAGVHQLWLRMLCDASLRIGKLGRFKIPAGTYVYTGRASRGLQARVSRHVRGGRRIHWHIDYLLAHRQCWIERVALATTDPAMECAVNQSMGSDGSCIVPGFGASDCMRKCKAHLWRVEDHKARPDKSSRHWITAHPTTSSTRRERNKNRNPPESPSGKRQPLSATWPQPRRDRSQRHVVSSGWP